MSLSEDPCISLLVVAGFVLDAIFPLECFSNMAVLDEIVSQRVEFFCALSVFVYERNTIFPRLGGLQPPRPVRMFALNETRSFPLSLHVHYVIRLTK